MKPPTLELAALAIWIGTCVCSQAIEIQGHTASANDRFANDPSFIGSGYDWSGVGRATSGIAGKGGHWATMISSNVFISANHYHPSTGSSLYFYPNNNSASSPVVRTIAGGQRIGTSDLWIGYIDQVLPNTVNYFNRVTQTLTATNFASSIVADENALVTGITPTAGGYGSDKRTSMAVGRNIIDNYLPALSVDGTIAPAITTLADPSGDSQYVAHEAQLASGDSGGSLFIDVGGELQLAGVNWAIGSVDTKPGPQEEFRNASFYSYVGNYNTEIQSYIDDHAAVPAPEPSVSLSVMLGIGALLTLRSRR